MSQSRPPETDKRQQVGQQAAAADTARMAASPAGARPGPGADPVPGHAPEAAPRSAPLPPGLRHVLAPNPSPMTGPGTNSWILGRGMVAVIDPGPADPAHLAALMAALAPGERVAVILVTHAHRDHSGLAPTLSAATGAPVRAFGPAGSGRSARMRHLAEAGGLGGGEGLDHAFLPDQPLRDGEEISGPDWRLTALHTPGHTGDHLSFLWQDRLFCGDLVMGWSSTLISPPDGDLTDYLGSLERLERLGPRIGHAGHGADIADLPARIAALTRHRREREAQVLSALARQPGSAAELAARIYHDTPAPLMAAAARNVLAHLLDLEARALARAEAPLTPATRFHPAPEQPRPTGPQAIV